MKLIAALAAALIATTVHAANPPTPVTERAPDAAAAPKPATPPKPPKPAAAPNPNLVEAKTSTGKTIHYDCSKKGNATKTACKK